MVRVINAIVFVISIFNVLSTCPIYIFFNLSYDYFANFVSKTSM